MLIVTASFLFAEKGGLKFKGMMYSELGVLQTYKPDEKDKFDFTGKSVLSLNFKNRNRKFGKVEGSFDIIIPYGASNDK